ncbi:hypothetical protein HQ585_08430 [candidate division KSB1 bacterium]|nr:hypothetical protein [candidate division KSB1 bacterium]
MRATEKKAALLEFSTGHIECLYSQASFLKDAGYEVHLICPWECRDRVSIYDKVDKFHYLSIERSNHGYFKQALRIRKILKSNTIRMLIINTFMGKEILWLIPFMRGVRMGCILHWLGKLKKSVSLRMIQLKIRNFFVLSDHLLNQIPEKIRTHYQAFYPIFMPKFAEVALPRSDQDFWICMPGNIEYRRRNYHLLLEHLDDALDTHIKFILLGNIFHQSGDGLDFKQKLSRKGLADRFITFEGPIEDEIFQAYVKHSDLIMPLLSGRERYLTSAISGAFNLSFYYKIPMLIEKEYSGIKDLMRSSIIYDPAHLTATLNHLVQNRDPIQSRIQSMKNYPVFSYEVQQKRYVDFLEKLP